MKKVLKNGFYAMLAMAAIVYIAAFAAMDCGAQTASDSTIEVVNPSVDLSHKPLSISELLELIGKNADADWVTLPLDSMQVVEAIDDIINPGIYIVRNIPEKGSDTSAWMGWISAVIAFLLFVFQWWRNRNRE